MGRPKKTQDPEVIEVDLEQKKPDQEPTASPGDNTILTHAQAKKIEKKKLETKEKEKPVESIEEVLKHEHVFQCSFAPMGESKTVFMHKYNGKEYRYELTMKNRIYTLPADMSKEDKARYREALRDNGFVDITVINRGIIVRDAKNYEFRAVHPEHTERNPINCNLSFNIEDDSGNPMYYTDGPKKGMQIVKQISVIDGYVKTDDKQLYQALIKIGFRDAGKREVKE